VRVLARRRDGLAHEIQFEDGHTLLVDEPPEAGGAGGGPRPTQLLAASLASCVAITVEMYADRKGWDVGAVEVEVEATYDGYVPTRFGVRLKLPADLDEEQRKRLLRIASRCPVHKAIVGDLPVTVSDYLEPA
jgi:putative redox protein